MTPLADQKQFDMLVSQLTKLKPETSRDRILSLVEEKKTKVGGGYLTDQGALFLVASDLGVNLSYSKQDITKLEALTPDLQNVNVEAKVLATSPAKLFTRKSDSKTGLLAKLIVYDDTSTCSVSLWDSKAPLPISLDLKPGDDVKLASAYVRTGLDGSIVLNLGEKGTIERMSSKSEYKQIEERAIPIELILDQARFLVVTGIVNERPRTTKFNRADGTSGNLIRFSLRSESEENRQMRVVVWENPNPVFQNLSNGERITLVNVKSKLERNQAADGLAESLELHGDESTSILEYSEETLHWMKKNSADLRILNEGEKKNTSSASDPLPFIARVLSIGPVMTSATSMRLLLVDSKSRKFSTTATKDAIEESEKLAVNDLILCRPDTIDFMGLKVSVSKKGALARVGAKRPDIPSASSLETKIENLTEGAIASLYVMSLVVSVSREVPTKDGLVRRTELQIGDPTGEIRLYAWRELSKLLDNIPAGERLWLRAVEVQTHEGRKFLNFRNYSTIERGKS